jgi:hypothetical protein
MKEMLNSKHPLYVTWKMMRQRCTNPKAVGYKNYGGRGVKVCDRWQQFENFAKDVGARPSDKHTLDRHPNKHGDYEPNNWRWATSKDQNRNRRSNRLITYKHKTKTVTEWGEFFGMPPTRILGRLKYGWSFEDAVSAEPRTPLKLRLKSTSLTIEEWSIKLGIPAVTIYSRLYKGWPTQKILSTQKSPR